jgi:hypothetical protein
VLKQLNIVSGVVDKAAQADRMWEKLLELALFVRSAGRHRKPSEILKTFIKSSGEEQAKLSKSEREKLQDAFTFLGKAYKTSNLGTTRLATDQTHFYTMVTTLLSTDLLATVEHSVLTENLVRLAKIIEGKESITDEHMERDVKHYLSLSSEKTTDATRRKDRQEDFVKLLAMLAGDSTPKNQEQSPIVFPEPGESSG